MNGKGHRLAAHLGASDDRFPRTMVNSWFRGSLAIGSTLPQRLALVCTGISRLAGSFAAIELQRDGRSTMFLIRTAFWLTLILLVLPIDREEAGIAGGPGALETLSAMQTVVSDMRGFVIATPALAPLARRPSMSCARRRCTLPVSSKAGLPTEMAGQRSRWAWMMTRQCHQAQLIAMMSRR